MMNYQKVDAGLASALAEVADPEAREFTVFVHTNAAPTKDQETVLRQFGVNDPTAGRQVFTATLSAQAVEELTNQPWVRFLKLSTRLRPYGVAGGDDQEAA